MRVLVDLARCEAYAQCAFLAPKVFAISGDEALLYDPAPSDEHRTRVLRAAAACPVGAIQVDRLEAAPGLPATPRETPGRIVIVGASLAGLRAAETLRDEGFDGAITVIGDERYEPYDRPPLSKQVQEGHIPADATALPRPRDLDADWRLGVAATGLDIVAKRVRLSDGNQVAYDRLLIATGVRPRPWPVESEAALDGVFVVRSRDDAAGLRRRLAAGPARVLVIGAGFTGSEIASVCRELGVEVTVVEAGAAPLAGPLGDVIGRVAADVQREHGVDLRCRTRVTSLEGDGRNRLRRAHLSNGETIDVDLAVVALGGLRNVEWLEGSGLAVGPWGVACDTGCRAFDANGMVTDDIFVAGDVARSPQPLFGYQFIALEHWANTVEQATIAAHNMISPQGDRWPHINVPVFWSVQFGLNIKSVGVPPLADEVVVVQGSTVDRRFVAVYGHEGRMVGAVSFNQGKWLDFYQDLIARGAPFPPHFDTVDQPHERRPAPAGFADPVQLAHDATVVVTGHQPSDQRATLVRPTARRGLT